VAEKLSPAIFLDRDGTLMEDVDYCGDAKDVHVFDGVADSLEKLKANGFKLIVITNQSGIGRGYFTEKEYREVEREVARQIGDGLVEATYFCPHLPNDGCNCRKGAPAMVLQAARDHQVDLSRSYFIGDKKSDMECGRSAGTRTILVRTGYGSETDAVLADLTAKDLSEATEMVLCAAS
jgi:D-glycero-D-manno-heptose 1,7-bisphosphate phosphatase